MILEDLEMQKCPRVTLEALVRRANMSPKIKKKKEGRGVGWGREGAVSERGPGEEACSTGLQSLQIT